MKRPSLSSGAATARLVASWPTLLTIPAGLLVAAVQSTGRERIAAAVATIVSTVAVLALERTEDGLTRAAVYVVLAIPLEVDALVRWHQHAIHPFLFDSHMKRVAIPLVFVFLLAVAAEALRRRPLRIELRPVDGLVAALPALAIVPGLVVAAIDRNPLSPVGQDLGLVGLFGAAYLVGRLVGVGSDRTALLFLRALLALVIVQEYFRVQASPLYSLRLVAPWAAIAYALHRRGDIFALAFSVSLIVITLRDFVSRSPTQGIQIAAGAAVVGYWGLRRLRLAPRHAVVPVAIVLGAVALVGTNLRSTVTGRYHSNDASLQMRGEEAGQVRSEVSASPAYVVVGRGTGATVDMTKADPVAQQTYIASGRSLGAVNDVHLLVYEVLLKWGALGLAWIVLYALALLLLLDAAVESAVSTRDPAPLFLILVPVLILAASVATATQIFSNPVPSLALGMLVSLLAGRRTADLTSR
jgi:hypothetical protein